MNLIVVLIESVLYYVPNIYIYKKKHFSYSKVLYFVIFCSKILKKNFNALWKVLEKWRLI